MSKGNDGRQGNGREGKGEPMSGRANSEPRSSRSSVRMTAERARAIQAQADRTGRNQDFKARAMAAADRNAAEAAKDEPDET